MIDSLYNVFRRWSAKGSVWMISDTHLGDPCCKPIDDAWPSPEKAIEMIKSVCHKNDTLLHLGDVGCRADLLQNVKAYKVLISGNHDKPSEVNQYFDEVYRGPLLIGEKILLSHEPIFGLDWCLNIHGHIHDDVRSNIYHFQVVSNRIGYMPISLKEILKSGVMAGISSLHDQKIAMRVNRSKK